MTTTQILTGIKNWVLGKFYQKPAGGVPKTDLSSDVQTSLGKADAAVPNSTYNTKMGQIDASIVSINGKIPSEATSSNQLADKAYLASQISGFITKSVNDLTNYYLKSETYTKEEVLALIAAINQFHYEVYPSTSAVTSPANNVLYLIGPTGQGSDKYEEYVYPNSTTGWVKIGDTSIDLSGYVTTTALNTALASYYTKMQADTLLAEKEAVANKVTTIDGDSTDMQYPSAKAVFDSVALAASVENLENGTVIPALANNLASWAGSTQNANYTQEGVVETTGGDLSIDSSVPATLMSIAAKTDFAATKLIATGFNLLRRATAVGDGWYFMVPALPFGTINTASQPNGVLFTNSQGENLRPTVYFKPLASGVPTSVTDGTACAYTDASTGGKSYRFFTTSQAGYIIVSGIDRAATCAHIGWSKRYDEYIAIDNVNDAGSEVDIAAGIHALHSYDKMLTVGNVADRIEKSGDNQITWHRLVDHVQPTWTNTPVESEGEPTGDYIHTATISGMKAGGAAAFETLGITLLVDGTTISFTDQNATVENDYVKYELATEATGTASVSSSFTVEDWGLIIIQGAVGSAYISIAYAQGIPDSVRQMLSNIDNKTIPVIAEAMLYLYNENKALRELLTGKDNAVLPYIKAQTIECVDKMTMGAPDILESETAGAPSAANVPINWNEETMTVWNGCPRKIGQQYVDKASGKVYYAIKVTGSTSDWVALN